MRDLERDDEAFAGEGGVGWADDEAGLGQVDDAVGDELKVAFAHDLAIQAHGTAGGAALGFGGGTAHRGTSKAKWYEAELRRGQLRVTTRVWRIRMAERAGVGHVHTFVMKLGRDSGFDKPRSTHVCRRFVTRLSLWECGPILIAMGKLIRFPAARSRRMRRPAAGAFAAFGELELMERAQLKLMSACMAGATVVMAAVQLALG